MKKIIITGSSGFVGINLVKNLSIKHNLICPDRNDLKNIFEKKSDFDGVIHLAGKAHDLLNISNDEEYYDVNTLLTKDIFNKFIKSKSSFFIFFSSVKASADSINGILKEDNIPNPKTAYGNSKLKAENYILNEIKKINLKKINKRIYIIRPSMIHGPNNKGNLNLLFNVVKKGIPWPLGNFKNQRSFCSIDNLIYIINKLILGDKIKSGIYNVCDDEAISTNDLIKLMSSQLNKKNFILNISPRFIKLIANIGDVLNFPLNNERLKKLTESYVVSNKKIKNELNLSKMPYNARDGFIKTINSFK